MLISPNVRFVKTIFVLPISVVIGMGWLLAGCKPSGEEPASSSRLKASLSQNQSSMRYRSKTETRNAGPQALDVIAGWPWRISTMMGPWINLPLTAHITLMVCV